MSPSAEANRDRLHLVEGMLRALDDPDLLPMIDASARRLDALNQLIASGYSERQAGRILDMTLSRRTSAARADLVEQQRWLRYQISASDSPVPTEVQIPLRLIDEDPTTVCGERAFVLFADGVGRIEVGDPLPNDDIWNHVEGDLMYTTVQPINDEGLTGGGGDAWDDPHIAVTWAEPGSGGDPEETVFVVVGRVPDRFATVIVRQGELTMSQRPIHRQTGFPLNSSGPRDFTVVGRDSSGSETVLFSTASGVTTLDP